MHTPLTMTTLTLLLLTASPATSGDCTNPVNENCNGATEFGFTDLPLTVEGSLGCTNDLIDRPYFDVFYRYDCTMTGDYLFDLCGSLGDTYMRVYTGGCGFLPASSWVEDDDGCGGSPNSLDPMIVTRLEADESYWIEIGSWRDAPQFPPNANDPYVFSAAYLGLCQADINRDGTADLTDLGMFVTLFIQGDLGADMNGDGLLDLADLARFVSVFSNEC